MLSSIQLIDVILHTLSNGVINLELLVFMGLYPLFAFHAILSIFHTILYIFHASALLIPSRLIVKLTN